MISYLKLKCVDLNTTVTVINMSNQVIRRICKVTIFSYEAYLENLLFFASHKEKKHKLFCDHIKTICNFIETSSCS